MLNTEAARPPLQESENSGAGDYISSLVENGIDVPDPVGLTASLSEVLGKYNLEAAFLKDNPKEALLIAGVASQMMVPELDDAAVARYDVVMQAILGTHEKEDPANTSLAERAVEKYTNHELSPQLAEVFDGPFFADVRSKTGISAVEKSDINVRVLDVAPSDGSGLPRLLDLSSKDIDIFKAHEQELTRRTKAFATESGKFQGSKGMPDAWMSSDSDGKSTIFMPALPAEELIAVQHEGLDEQKAGYVLDQARHELTHCIKNLFLDNAFFGVALGIEERRAEYFSGDRQGYPDVKRTFDFILGIHNATIEDILPSDGTYSPQDTYERLAKTVGLENMLDLMTALPSNYVSGFEQAGWFNRTYLRAGNDMNDAILRILRRAKQTQGEAYSEQLIDNYVDSWVSQLEESGTDKAYVPDNLAFGGPTVLSVLAIKNFKRRYPGLGEYDWAKAYGDSWGIEI